MAFYSLCFHPHRCSAGAVGLCSVYYAQQNVISELIFIQIKVLAHMAVFALLAAIKTSSLCLVHQVTETWIRYQTERGGGKD